MSPTFVDGEKLLIEWLSARRKSFSHQVGDIVLVRDPQNPDGRILKRICAAVTLVWVISFIFQARRDCCYETRIRRK
jgi:hypothetical protein